MFFRFCGRQCGLLRVRGGRMTGAMVKDMEFGSSGVTLRD